MLYTESAYYSPQSHASHKEQGNNKYYFNLKQSAFSIRYLVKALILNGLSIMGMNDDNCLSQAKNC